MAFLRAIRGATTLEADTTQQLRQRVGELLREMLHRNAIATDDIVSVFFTATDDISSGFPATSARVFGLEDVPLLGAQELRVEGATALCVRVLLHFHTSKPRGELQHVYLHRAADLRPDLSAPTAPSNPTALASPAPPASAPEHAPADD